MHHGLMGKQSKAGYEKLLCASELIRQGGMQDQEPDTDAQAWTCFTAWYGPVYTTEDRINIIDYARDTFEYISQMSVYEPLSSAFLMGRCQVSVAVGVVSPNRTVWLKLNNTSDATNFSVRETKMDL